MASIVILDTEKPVEFLDEDGAAPIDQDAVMAALQKVADLVNATTWTQAQRDAFNGMKKIVFFRGSVLVDGYDLSRPGCSQANAVFYWEVGEFLRIDDAGVRANTFFHDCWHVVQFKQSGPAQEDERVAREIDAVDRQIEVAQVLNCYQADIDYLRRYENDPEAIRARLDQGLHTHHNDPVPV